MTPWGSAAELRWVIFQDPLTAPSRFLGCTFDRIKAKLSMTWFVRFESCQFTDAKVGDWFGDYAELVDCVFGGHQLAAGETSSGTLQECPIG